MKRVLSIAGSVLGIAALMVLAAALLLTFGGQGERPGAQEPGAVDTSRVALQPPPATPTVAPYPPPPPPTVEPLATPTPEPYPPPPTMTPVPTATQPLSPTAVPVTPTPFPTSTPVPTWTPMPGAASIILYRRRDPEGNALYHIPLDVAGRPVAPPARIRSDLGYTGPLYPSPDGRYVAIVHGVETGELINILHVASGQITPLIRDLRAAAFGSPGQFLGWHPSSREVLYKTINGSEPGLWRVSIHSGRYQVLAQPDPPDGISGGAISPDGRTLAYAWYRSIGFPGQIWMANADGSEPRLIVEGGVAYVFSWSPDGVYLAYVGELSSGKGSPPSGGPLWIIDANGQNRRPLQGPFIFGWGFIPVWSPDGSKIAYVGTSAEESFGEKPVPSSPAELDDWLLRGTSVYVEDVITGELRRLSAGIDPAWSPDGTRIVFVSNQSGTSEIWTINVDGTDLRQITTEGIPSRYPVWVSSSSQWR